MADHHPSPHPHPTPSLLGRLKNFFGTVHQGIDELFLSISPSKSRLSERHQPFAPSPAAHPFQPQPQPELQPQTQPQPQQQPPSILLRSTPSPFPSTKRRRLSSASSPTPSRPTSSVFASAGFTRIASPRPIGERVESLAWGRVFAAGRERDNNVGIAQRAVQPLDLDSVFGYSVTPRKRKRSFEILTAFSEPRAPIAGSSVFGGGDPAAANVFSRDTAGESVRKIHCRRTFSKGRTVRGDRGHSLIGGERVEERRPSGVVFGGKREKEVRKLSVSAVAGNSRVQKNVRKRESVVKSIIERGIHKLGRQAVGWKGVVIGGGRGANTKQRDGQEKSVDVGGEGQSKAGSSTVVMDMRKREVCNIAKEYAGLDEKDLKSCFPPEVIELWEENPLLSGMIFKKHGKNISNMVEAKYRKVEREAQIRQLEQDVERMQVKVEVGKGGEGLSKGLRKILGIEEEDEDEQEEIAPEGDYYDNVYWSEDDEDIGGWDEAEDEVAMEEKKKGTTVVNESSPFSKMTETAMKRLRRVMGNTYSGAQLANVNGCIITGEDLMRLKPGVWLNDEIVNAYFELLAKRTEERKENEGDGSKGGKKKGGVKMPKVKVLNSFFYSRLVQYNRKMGYSMYDYTRVRRWTRRFDVFSYDLLLIPINQQNTHWTLGVVNFRDKEICHMDSMGNGGSVKVRENLLAWVKDEAGDKKKGQEGVFVGSEWKMVERLDVPQQKNSDDCGVFTCKVADWLTRGWNKFTFSQRHMDYFRGRIAHELLMGRAA